MRRRDKSSRARTAYFLSLSLRRPRPPLAFHPLFLSRGTRDGGTAAPPMLCKSSSVCMASLFRLASRSAPILCILSCLRPPLRAPDVPFPSVQSSAVVTSFVRKEANVIYEQSRRRRHPNRRPRRRSRRHPRRVVGRDAAFVGFRLQFPLFQSNSYFPRGLLACDDNGNGARHGRETSRRIERANG